MTELRLSALQGRIALEMSARGLLALVVLVAALAGLLIASVALGTEPLAFGKAMAAMVGAGDERAVLLVTEFRLPRALVAMAAGGLLGLSGALTQGATRNPLADPALLGISQGAALAVIAFSVLTPGLSDLWRPGVAFVGGLCVAAAILVLSMPGRQGEGSGTVRLLLTGIGLASFLGALTTALLTYGGVNEAHSALAWIAGSVRTVGWGEVWLLVPAAPIAALLALLAARPLAVLRLGDDLATTLGHPANRARIALLSAAAALAATSVSVVGPVAFVGLVAPHLAVRLAHSGPGLHLALSAAVGAVVTGAADLAGRILVAPVQIPAGIVTALIGAPLMVLLMIRALRGRPE